MLHTHTQIRKKEKENPSKIIRIGACSSWVFVKLVALFLHKCTATTSLAHCPFQSKQTKLFWFERPSHLFNSSQCWLTYAVLAFGKIFIFIFIKCARTVPKIIIRSSLYNSPGRIYFHFAKFDLRHSFQGIEMGACTKSQT